MNQDVQAAVVNRLEELLVRLDSSREFEAVPLGRVEYLINDMRKALENPDTVTILIPEDTPPYPARRSPAQVADQLREVLRDLYDAAPSGFLLGQLDILSVAVHRVLTNPDAVESELGRRD